MTIHSFHETMPLGPTIVSSRCLLMPSFAF
jgi:hypothetical protein